MKRIFIVVLVILLFCVSCSNNPIVDTNNQSTDYDWTKNINWRGESDTFPQNPEEGYAFYNTSNGYSYVYTAKQGWTPIAKSGLGITWLGEKNDFPSSPKYGDAFFNTLQGSSFVFDGEKWQLLARSGKNGASIMASKLQVSIDDVVLDYNKTTSWKIEYNPDKETETRTITVKNIGSETVYFSDEGAVVNNSYSGQTAYPNYYDLEANADISNVPLALDPNNSFTFTVSYNPSKYVSLYIYFYNTTLHNPLSISFTQSTNTNTNTNSNIQNPYISMSIHKYSPSFHHSLSSSSVVMYENKETEIGTLDFGICDSNANGNCAQISISTSGINNSLFFIGDPFIWIEGENAEDFTVDASTQKNLKLTKGESYSAKIIFTPKSIGEKTAVLHISTGFAGHEDIQIPLVGECVTIENYYDAYGYAPIDYSTHYFSRIVEDGQGGCFLITVESSKIYIYRVDFCGKCSLVKTLDYYYSLEYAEYSNGSLNLYLYGGQTSSYYKYFNAKVTINPLTYSYSTSSYSSSSLSNLKNPTVSGEQYELKKAYGGYILGIKDKSAYDCRLDVFSNEEQLLASVINVNPGSEYVDDICVSGDYLYFLRTPNCLRRIRLDELIEELKYKFNI